MNTPRIYVASKARFAPMWRDFRDAAGDLASICSEWIDHEGEPGSEDWRRWVTAAANADAVIAYFEPGDEWKGALVEIGAALGNGKRVYVVGGPVPGTWVQHPHVLICADLGDALDWAISESAPADDDAELAAALWDESGDRP